MKAVTNSYQFTPDDQMNPVYCLGCRSHIPLAASNAHNGYCPQCANNLVRKRKRDVELAAGIAVVVIFLSMLGAMSGFRKQEQSNPPVSTPALVGYAPAPVETTPEAMAADFEDNAVHAKGKYGGKVVITGVVEAIQNSLVGDGMLVTLYTGSRRQVVLQYASGYRSQVASLSKGETITARTRLASDGPFSVIYLDATSLTKQ